MSQAGSIRAIPKASVHRICSGQVILDLATAVKELVENALDAGATNVEIRLREYGADLIEVSDNGSGVPRESLQGLTRKYHTSKLENFDQLDDVGSFGFRGEALSSLCALGDIHVVTCTKDDAAGVKAVYDREGELVSQEPCARAVGTTVAVKELFSGMPVRRKELLRTIKREYAKLLTVLQAYALIATDVRMLCTNQAGKGPRSTVLNTSGAKTVLAAFSTVFGPKQGAAVQALDHTVDASALGKTQADDDSAPSSGPVPDFMDLAAGPTGRRSSGAASSGARRSLVAPAEDGGEGRLRIVGLVSKPGSGGGRASGDRQFFYVNGRPVDLPKASRILNDAYRSLTSPAAATHKPMAVINFLVGRGSFDINLAPDKRQVLLHKERAALDGLRQALESVWEPSRCTYKVQDPTTPANAPQTAPPAAPATLPTPTEARELPTRCARRRGARERAATPPLDDSDAGGGQEVGAGAEDVAPSRRESDAHTAPAPDEEATEPAAKRPRVSDDAADVAAGDERAGRRPPRPRHARSASGAAATALEEVEVEDGDGADEADVDAEDGEEVELVVQEAAPPPPSLQQFGLRAPPLAERPRGGAPASRPGRSAPPGQRSLQQFGFQADADPEPRPPARAPRAGTHAQAPTPEPPQSPAGVPAAEDAEAARTPARAAKRRRDPATPARPSFPANLYGLYAITPSRYDGVPGAWRGGGDSDASELAEDESAGARGEASEGAEARDGEECGGGGVEEGGAGPEDRGAAEAASSPRTGGDGGGVGDGDVEMLTGRELSTAQALGDGGGDSLGPRARARQQGPHGDLGVDFSMEALRSDWARLLASTREAQGRGGDAGRSVGCALHAARLADAGAQAGAQHGRDAAQEVVELPAEECDDAGRELERVFDKKLFREMQVVGQFNLGFIIARLGEDLFIVDQHASDEKCTFERLCKETVLTKQPLIKPARLDLGPAEEVLVREKLPLFEANGFTFADDPESGRLVLTSVPVSRGVTLGANEVAELVGMLAGNEESGWMWSSGGGRRVPRPAKVRAMLAMRACRSSIMIGKVLDRKTMAKVLAMLSTLDSPWNCPHGRPTMRHLCVLPARRDEDEAPEEDAPAAPDLAEFGFQAS
ncbi:unnamed protein product [Pedinophyceae sp. YPF-701]|nr:unnamed protein product [Pedinophyceae sp. YPF-701]